MRGNKDDERQPSLLDWRPKETPSPTPPAVAHPPSVVRVPHSDTDTSLDAAIEQADSGRAAIREHIVLDAIKLRARTDDELAADLGWDGNSIRPRRWSLERRGLVRWSGEKRKTRSGRSAKVWEAV